MCIPYWWDGNCSAETLVGGAAEALVMKSALEDFRQVFSIFRVSFWALSSEAVHWLSVASKLHSVQQFSVLLTNLFILGLKFGELFVNLDCLLLIFCSLEIAVNILFSIRARNWGVAALRADKLGSC